MLEGNSKSPERTFIGTVNFLWIIFLLSSLFCGSCIFYDYINDIVDFTIILIGPVFIVLSILTILIPSYYKVIYLNRFFSNFIRLFGALFIILSLVFIYDLARNSSPVIYSVKFFWEEEVDLEFRENNTFRARNSDMFSSSVTYGDYRRENDKIILLDNIKFGMSEMNDTLIINQKGIDFTLEKPWRISGGTLYYTSQR